MKWKPNRQPVERTTELLVLPEERSIYKIVYSGFGSGLGKAVSS